ncbi:MAG: hypothetical protein KFB93_07725 [Simkaniaceae bacterium]|nr:MAG: hypothetical protein KFB93_07725 [Simkaniaceae bacterium]
MSSEITRWDDAGTRFKKHWLNLSEHIWSIPGHSAYKHNYKTLHEETPALGKIQQVFAWAILAVAMRYRRPLGFLLIAASLAPKVIHRTTDVSVKSLKISPVTLFKEFVSCTYNGGKVGINICDWAYTSMSGFSMLFDGVGHNDPVIVKEQAFYAQMARAFETFVEQFNYNQEGVADVFLNEADQQVKNIHTCMHEYQEARYPQLALKGTEELNSHKQRIRTNRSISREQTFDLLWMLRRDKAEEFLHTLQSLSESEKNDGINNLIECFELLCHLLAKRDEEVSQSGTLKGAYLTLCSSFFDHAEFEQAVSKLMNSSDEQAKIDFFAHLKHKHESLGRAGPAFGVAHIFKDEKDQRYLYVNRVADIGFVVIKPKESEESVDLSDFTAEQCEWIHESGKSSGLGAEKEYQEKGQLIALPKGSVVLGFTDGVGEFLTREEVIETIHQWGSNPETPLTELFAGQISKHPKGGFDDKLDPKRIKACADHTQVGVEGRPQERLYCKKFDPTGNDAGGIDDIGVTVMVAR